MSYLIVLILSFFIVLALPKLLYFFLMLWIVITVVRMISILFTGNKTRHTYRQNNNRTYTQENGSTKQRNSDDIIDVEYTERDADDQ